MGQLTFGMLAFLLCAVTIRAEHIVLLSETDDFTVGQILPDPVNLNLESGERIVLLSDRGELLDIVGPVAGTPVTPGSDDFNVRDALTNLIENPNNLHASLGGTRGGTRLLSTVTGGPVWRLDPLASGVQCYVEGEALVFGQPVESAPASFHVQRPGHEGTGLLRFERETGVAPWPLNIPAQSGELYVVRREGYMDSSLFRLALLPSIVLENTEVSIAWLAAHGCTRQAAVLLKNLPG
jgi:hypothetical protein